MSLVYLTKSNQIQGLARAQYEALPEMHRAAKNLYYVALYSMSLRTILTIRWKYLGEENVI